MGREAGAPSGQDPADAQGQDPNPTAGDGDDGNPGQDPAAGGEPKPTTDPELSKVRKEAGEWRTKFRGAETAREAAEAAHKTVEAKVATLSEENAKLKAEVGDYRLRSAVGTVAGKLGFRSPELAYRVIERGALKLDDKGEPTNIEELLGAVLEANPYLAKPDTDFGGGNRGGSPNSGPGMTELIRAATGRG